MKLIPNKNLITATVYDKKTKKERPAEGQGFLLGPRPGVCQECAVDHKPEDSHDATSLSYQYFFYNEHKRWPTWIDAMAHCDEEHKKAWGQALSDFKIDWQTGDLRPKDET